MVEIHMSIREWQDVVDVLAEVMEQGWSRLNDPNHGVHKLMDNIGWASLEKVEELLADVTRKLEEVENG